MTARCRAQLLPKMAVILFLPVSASLSESAVAQPLPGNWAVPQRIDRLERLLDRLAPRFEKRYTPDPLLADVRIHRDTVAGKWTKTRELKSPASGMGVLKLPTDVPEMYDLTLTVKRLGGDNTFAVRLVAQGRSFLACVDAHDGQAWCGLEMLDGRWVHQNEATSAGGVLKTGRPCTLVFSVRDRGVTVTADGKQVIRWRGDFSRLSTSAAVPGDHDLLSILTYSSFAISRIELTPISSEMRLNPR
jgi:hypothetical protein